MKKIYFLFSCLFLLIRSLSGQGTRPDLAVETYDVSWDKPGPGSAESMPIGNGDIGCNVWTDSTGDILFYISKTDAWGGEKDPTADSWMQQGGVLMKLGLIRVSLRPRGGSALFRQSDGFRQTLRLGHGDILITEGAGDSAVRCRLWVDANHPVIRIEVTGVAAREFKVTLSDWRLGKGDSVVEGKVVGQGDVVAPANGRLTWYHRNPGPGDDRLADPHLANITFGATMEFRGTMEGAGPNSRLISIHPLTATVSSADIFLHRLARQVVATDALPVAAARAAHETWWRRFWDRSYIYVRGSATADSVTRGYILQRFVTACAGRGAYPIKFNGSIFVVDNPAWMTNGKAHPMNADFRAWGGQYWWQNTRAMYWPCLQAGDFDLMLPLFRMYVGMLPGNAALVRQYYGHAGAYFQETSPFWGGLPFMGPGEPALYTHHYFTPILEQSMICIPGGYTRRI